MAGPDPAVHADAADEVLFRHELAMPEGEVIPADRLFELFRSRILKNGASVPWPLSIWAYAMRVWSRVPTRRYCQRARGLACGHHHQGCAGSA